MNRSDVSLEDKYRLERGRVFLTGVQALARLPMLQAQRDRAAGLNTAGYISGYRGSPLGGLDRTLEEAAPYLAAQHIRFQPGVNEELAATAIWGTQQVHLFPQPQVDGVFAMWYGKGPGVDRCGDVFKHANYAGTSRHGGVLLIAGDDHGARSSAVAHQSEHAFSACGIPVLAPASLGEYLEFGLHGWAMSRYSGCWVAMKITSDSVESSASVDLDTDRLLIATPEDFLLPPDGLHIRWPDPQLAQERRMQEFKVYAALAYARANGLNRFIFGAETRPARLGIVAGGKAYLDVRQALADLGIDEAVADSIGLRLYKVGMPWPLEADGVRRFATGLEEILVVEEKRPLIEYQLKEQLYSWRADVRPRVVGKFDESGEWPAPHGQWLVPPTGELTPTIVARAIASRLRRFHSSPQMAAHLALLDAKDQAAARPNATMARSPYFCSGCPHNLSTRVPEGSFALAGVGCHLMAVGMQRSTLTICQMGGEGAAWLGIAGHSGTQHIFANLGDGTYFHSGILAIRAVVAAYSSAQPGAAQRRTEVTPSLGEGAGGKAVTGITYKILFNDAVAMTGGQSVDGTLTVPQLARQLAAEGVPTIVVLADDPKKYPSDADFPPGIEVRHRDELDFVQRQLRTTPGVSVIIYDQTCAAEKRRRRKRGKLAEAEQRVFINELVCEGCGDCSAQSNCLSVVPIETEFGRKRAIDQFSCNMDYSCVNGFCPSLVTVSGKLRRSQRAVGAGAAEDFPALPEPALPSLAQPYSILITGIGGTGVITIGALIGMAAHLEGKGVTVLDMTGLAQKGGAVTSHVRLAMEPAALHSARIASGAADLLLGCDVVVAVSADALSKCRDGLTRAVVNSGRAITGDFVRNPDHAFPLEAMTAQLTEAVGAPALELLDATRLASLLVGDSISSNAFMLGVAWQKGLIPVSHEALLEAFKLNGVAVAQNSLAFLWGRRAAHDPARVAAIAATVETVAPGQRLSSTPQEVVARRRDYLTAYQDAAYAQRYTELVQRVSAAERAVAPQSSLLTDAVARNAFKLMAYKDEYEVARLFCGEEFQTALRASFADGARVRYHFAAPFLARRDPRSGSLKKRSFGPWLAPALSLLAKMKFLRGTPFDPFAGSAERKLERALLSDYAATVQTLLEHLRGDNLAAAAAIASLPESVRGYGEIKARAAEEAARKRTQMLAAYLS